MERAVAFDVMGTLFDAAPVETQFGADALPRLLHTAVSLTLAGDFVPFPQLVETLLGTDALDTFSTLDAYPDAAAAIQTLVDDGVRAIALTNGSADNTRTLLGRAGLELEMVVTTEEAQAYKPAAAPYHLACERLQLPPGQVTLIAAHAWDVYGALAAGLSAVLVDRDAAAWPFPLPEPQRAASLGEAAASASSAGRPADR